MASYRVLARKWRPQTFEDLIGQEFPAVALRNSIQSGKIAHALLFAGPRGTGKTSTARIVAKAVNCEKRESGKYPCSKKPCSSCENISEGKSLDVQEIDAASHTGVADVREIIESVKYTPSSGTKKVYIIDEVHMLSQSAFNALLKVMEEPPDHAVFVLATTEVHKVPQTILSRCQIYDFKKISVAKIQQSLENIANAEEITIDSETIHLIAKESEGSMRDSLSLLDQLTASFADRIIHEEVIKLLGIPDNESLLNIAKAIFEKDPAKCIELIRNASSKGISSRRMTQDLIYIFRNLIYLKICGKDFVSDLSPDEKDELAGIVKNESTETVELLFNLLIDSGEKMRNSFYPEVVLELTLVKMSTIGHVEKIDEILKRLENLKTEKTTSRKEDPTPVTSEIRNLTNGESEAETMEKGSEKAGNSPKILKDSETGVVGKITGKEDIINFLNEKKERFFAKKVSSAHSVEVVDNQITIKFLKNGISYEKDLKEGGKFREILKEMFGKSRMKLSIETVDDEVPGDSKRIKRTSTGKDDMIDYAVEQLGATVINRKNLIEE